MPFSDEFIDEIVERNDIVSVVSEYVNLSKNSASNMFGLCPFHDKKTPSFSVSPSKQIYHCFGCGKGGGVINFLMEIENISYPDAVKRLASRAGLALPETEYNLSSKKWDRIYTLNKSAAKFYHERLSSPDGKRQENICIPDR